MNTEEILSTFADSGSDDETSDHSDDKPVAFHTLYRPKSIFCSKPASGQSLFCGGCSSVGSLNSFEEFITKTIYIQKVSSQPVPKTKLSTLVEYYKFWCLYNDKHKIDCYHHEICPQLIKHGFDIVTCKGGKNKKTKYVRGMIINKIA